MRWGGGGNMLPPGKPDRVNIINLFKSICQLIYKNHIVLKVVAFVGT